MRTEIEAIYRQVASGALTKAAALALIRELAARQSSGAQPARAEAARPTPEPPPSAAALAPGRVVLRAPGEAKPSARPADASASGPRPLRKLKPLAASPAQPGRNIAVQVSAQGEGVWELRLRAVPSDAAAAGGPEEFARCLRETTQQPQAKVIIVAGDAEVFDRNGPAESELPLIAAIHGGAAGTRGALAERCDFVISGALTAGVEASARSLASELAAFPRECLVLLKRHFAEQSAAFSAMTPAFDSSTMTDTPAHARSLPQNFGTPVAVRLASPVVRAVAYPDGVFVATLRDEVGRNAFSAELTQGIQEVFAHLRTHRGYKVAILTGYDRIFASGGTKEGLLSIQQGAARYSDAPLYEMALSCEIPVIAAMQGHATGAGWSFGMYCDYPIFSEESLYSSRFLRYGFTPGFGSTLIFPLRFGSALGREILFTARDYTGSDLRERGMAMPVVPRARVLDTALVFAHRLATASRETLVAAKHRRTAPVLAQLPAFIREELAMHDRTFVGNAGALEKIQRDFAAPPRPPTGAASPRPAPVSGDADEQLEAIRQALRSTLAEELQLDPADIDEDRPFTDLGLDSISGVTWVRRVNKRFGASINANQVYHAPTLREFAQLLRREATQLSELTRADLPLAPLEMAPPPRESARHPLSEGQNGLWMLHRLDPAMAAYNVPVAFRIADARWADAVDPAIAALRRRHPILETVIGTDENAQPFQRIPPRTLICVQRERIECGSEAEMMERLRRAFKTPFALQNDPLMRVQLFAPAAGDQFLLVTLHHILFDGTSLVTFIRDFLAAWAAAVNGVVNMAANPPPASVAPPAFFEFVAWEQTFLQSDAARKELGYWKRQLDGDLPILDFPADRPRPAQQTFTGATVSAQLPAELSDRIRALAKERKVSLFTLLLAIYQGLLQRYTRQETIVVGVPVARRPEERFADAIGFFVNMVAAKAVLRGDAIFTDVLEQTKWTVLEAIGHAQYPFSKLVSELGIQPNPAHAPVFQTVFVLQNFLRAGGFSGAVAPDAGIELLADLHQEGEYDLRLEVVEQGRELTICASYNPELHTPAKMARLLEHYGNLAAAIVADPGRRLVDYSCVGIAEQRQIETEWNATTQAYPRGQCIHDIWVARAAERPDAVAIVAGDERLTYGEVERRSTLLARYLQSLGVGPERRVALCLKRSPEMIVGVLGVLKAGGAYVPLDPAYPAERMRFLLDDCGAAVVLTDESSAGAIRSAQAAAVRVVLLDRDWPRIEQEGAALSSSGRDAVPENLAYVIYTSGSTGKPKGVMVEHRQILNTLHYLEEAYPVGERDAYLLKTSYTFDVSLSELFGWFMGRGRVVVLPPGDERFPERIAEAIRICGVTHVNFVPSAFAAFLQALRRDEAFGREGPLKFVMVAGEALPKALASEAARFFAGAKVENIYGPTETAIYASGYSCRPEGFEGAHTPIGGPLPNTRLYVLDMQRKSTGLGVPGELAIAGDSVARGYLNRPELTAERFIADPFEPGARMFLTGDLARWLPDGTIEYLGRIDQQIKVRGFRVEPGEIETCLQQHPGVREAVVVAVEKSGSKQLVAYFVPQAGAPPESAELTRHLAAKLPDYMVPAFIVPLEAIPFTPSGKVDRQQLENRALAPERRGEQQAPQGGAETIIATIWKKLLRLETVSATDRFFEVGGDSLLAVALADQVGRAFNRPFSAAAVFKHPTIQALAELVDGPREASPLTRDQRPETKDQRQKDQETKGLSENLTGSQRISDFKESGPAEPVREVAPLAVSWSRGVLAAEYERNAARAPHLQVPVQVESTGGGAADAGAPDYYGESLAIIGISCRFPGAEDVGEFWEMLREGREGGRFLSKEELSRRGVPAALADDPRYVPLEMAVRGKDEFDPEFFHLSGRHALLMDPQFRALLMHAWNAVEDAGYAPADIPDTSVFMSAGNSFYRGALEQSGAVEKSDEYASWVLAQGGTIPAMVSYCLGLSGPSLFVHSNCSSSLSALYLAQQSVQTGASKQALVGAATLFHAAQAGYLYRPGLNFASDGHCRTFDAAADGMVGSEGVAVVLVKRARDAWADGDPIYAIVRGIAINNDGAEKAGFYSPAVRGQAAVIEKVLQTTRIDPETIGYIEAHGTGTSLGDPVEVMALADAYKARTRRTQFCGLGSVKTNIGHADTAAGLAGCIKLALSLQHRTLPPSLNFERPNPAIEFTDSPFYVVDRLTPWDATGGAPRRAALSSFGIGGTNVHAVLEEPMERAAESVENGDAGPRVIVLSARNPERLNERMGQLRAYLQRAEPIALADLAGTLWTGRAPMAARAAFVVHSMDELGPKLDAAMTAEGKILTDGFWIGVVDARAEELLSQDEAETMAAKWRDEGRLDKIAKLWVRGVTVPWSRLFPDRQFRRLHLPTYPFAKDRFVLPTREADVPAPPGTPAGRARLHPLLHENISTRDQMQFQSVFSGEEFFLADHVVQGRKVLPGVAYLEMARTAIAQAMPSEASPQTKGPKDQKTKELSENLTCSQRLSVFKESSETAGRIQLHDIVWLRPFAMETQPRSLLVALATPEPSRMTFEVYSESADGGRVIHCRGKALIGEAAEPARRDVAALRREPGRRQIGGDACYAAFTAAGFTYGDSMRSVREIFVADERVLARIELPTVVRESQAAFDLHPSLLDGALQAAVAATLAVSAANPAGNGAVLLALPFALEKVVVHGPCPAGVWAMIQPADGVRAGDRVQRRDIDLCDDDGHVCVSLRGYATSQPANHGKPDASMRGGGTPPTFQNGSEIRNYRQGDFTAPLIFRPAWRTEPVDPDRVMPALGERLLVCCGVPTVRPTGATVHTLNADLPAADAGEWFTEQAGRIFEMVQAALRQKHGGTVLMQLAIPAQGAASSLGAIAGTFRTAHLENPKFFGQVIELPAGENEASLLQTLEANACCLEDVHVRTVAGARRVFRWEEAPASDSADTPLWREDGVYLLTGGAGALGLHFAREILEHAPKARVVLAGRTPRSAAELVTLGLLGERVEYCVTDVSRASEVDALARHLKERYGRLDGVLHAAGVIHDNFIIRKTADEFRAVLAPKVGGTLLLERALGDLQPEFIALFSSGVAAFGNPGQADYATANAFLDHFARSHDGGPRIVSIDWPLWKEGGMRAGGASQSSAERAALMPLETSDGVAVLGRALRSTDAQWMVLSGAPEELRRLVRGTRRERVEAAVESLALPADPATLRAGITEWVRTTIAEVVKLAPEKIGGDTPFEKFGLDSILQVTVIEKFEQVVGELAKTLLFEYTTLAEVADYFLREHATKLARIFRTGAQRGAAATETVNICSGAPRDPSVAKPMEDRMEGRQRPHSTGSGQAGTRDQKTTILERDTQPAAITRTPTVSTPAAEETFGEDAIAIIGVSGRYPMANSPEALWENLKAGRNCISKADRPEWDASFLHGANGGGGAPTGEPLYGGFMDRIDRFDHALFDVRRDEVARISPEARLFLEIVWELFEDAGYSRAALRALQQRVGSGVGVFAATMYNQYAWSQPSLENAALGSNATEWHIPNRVSHFFDLTGPSMAVNSACSGSLLAIHLACESLLLGNCAMAVAGGVNLTLLPSKYPFLKAAGVLGAGDRSRSLGEGDGYIPGEGVGAVLLKPLARAQADGDRIQGVIRASFANHSGGRQVYTAPDPTQQARLITEVIRRARIEARSISYVESAVNGSRLGDPIEILALKKAFASLTHDRAFCAIGSVKSNLGHLEAASGISQLSKVLLQFRHQLLVPSLHSRPRNPAIKLEGTPFYVQEECSAWLRPVDAVTGRSWPRRSLISSIGAGGTAVSLVVEEYQAPANAARSDAPDASPALWLFSAKSEASLMAYLERVYQFLGSDAGASLQGIAFTLRRRNPLEVRAALVVESRDAALAQLAALRRQRAADLAAGVFVSWGAVAAASGATKEPARENEPLRAQALRWVAGGVVEDETGSGRATLCAALPKYAFDHAHSFAFKAEPAAGGPARARFHFATVSEMSGGAGAPRSQGGPGGGLAKSEFYSGADAFLRDHTLGGRPVLIGVAHASLAARAFFEWFPDEPAVLVQPLTFLKPVELNSDDRAEVRARRASGEPSTEFAVEFRLEPGTSWELTASGRVQRSEFAFGKMPPSSFPRALPPVTDLAAIYAAGEPHFKVGPSFRVIRQLYCGETEALARLDLGTAADGGACSCELHPLIAYSAYTVALPLLIAAGFRDAFLPFGIKSLHFRRGYSLKHCWILVRLVKSSGELALFDADVVTPEFDHVAVFRGCSVKRLRLDPATRSASSATELAREESISAIPSGDAELAVQSYLRRKLQLGSRPVDLDANLMELGLASAQLVGLAAEIQSELCIELDPTVFFEYPNLRELMAFFAREHGPRFAGATTTELEKATETSVEPAGQPEAVCKVVELAAQVDGLDPWPLSEAQKGLWLLQHSAPEMTAYHCPLCFHIRQAVDPGVFEAACRFLLRQHPVLCAGIEERAGAPMFVPRLAEDFVLERVDAVGWTDAQIRAWIDRAMAAPFELSRGPLLRGALLRVGSREAVAVFVVHHVAFDGASFALFIETLTEAYGALRIGQPPRLRPLTARPADFVEAERRQLAGAEGAKRLAYWREQLAGELPQLDVYPDFPRALSTLHAGRVVSARIEPELGRTLKAFAHRNAVYPSALFLSAFKHLLHVCSRQDDLIVGLPVTERAEPRFRPLIGCFVNMVPLRSRGVGERPFREFVKAVQRTMVNALAHRCPFPALVRELNLSASGHPVFQAAFEYQNFLDGAAASEARGAGATALPIEWIEGLHQRGEYELALEVYERGDGFQLNLKFNPTLLHDQTAERMLERIATILQRGVASPDQPIPATALISARERLTLREWNDTSAEYPRNLCIHEWFERQAQENPDAVAIVFRDTAMSYRELEERSRALAIYLQGCGVKPDVMVGLCVERSFEMLVGILGILRAGGAYLPLDPEYPEERLQFMVRDSQTRWVLTQAHLANKVGRIGGSSEVLALDGDDGAVQVAASSGGRLRRDVRPGNLACVIYTSGSTGQPKGVLVGHESMCNRIVWMQRVYALTPEDVVLQKTPFSFDVSGWEFHWPMLVGARLILAEPGKHRDPEYIRDVIHERGVTVLHFVPSMLQAFLAVDGLERCRGLRLTFCSGEELTVAQTTQFFERFETTELHNLYGPTEAAIDVTAWRCHKGAAVIPIGKPISNVRLYIVDASRALLPIGLAGELCLGGDCLARGYLNRPELTAEKFVENPFEPGARMYRTGDLARWGPDGNVQYLGRIDHQVKIRGFRIELGEIEDALARVEGIEQVVVLVAGDAAAGRRLVAYYVIGDGAPDATDLRSLLRQRLPDYMVPGAFVRLERMPLTASGKINRRALAQRPAPAPAPSEKVAPRNPLEARLQRIWQRELRIEAVGIHDSFFDVGGHSLLALAVIGRINAEFGARLPLATLFEARTIAELGARLGAGATVVPRSGLIALQPAGTLPPIHLVPGIGGSSASFLALSGALGDTQPVFAFQFPGVEEGSEPLASVTALAELFEDQLLRAPLPGIYTVGGWSFGGVIAFEVARRLEQRNLPVRLILLDSYLAEHFERFGIGASQVRLPRADDPAIQRRIDAVMAAGERALREHRASGTFGGESLCFHATRHAGSVTLAGTGNGDSDRDAASRAAEETRLIWQRYLPRLNGNFVPVDASHETILAPPAATILAGRIREFTLPLPLTEAKQRETAPA